MINISRNDILSTNFIDEFYSLEKSKEEVPKVETALKIYKLAVVVESPISESEKQFLFKIVSAVGITIDEIELLTGKSEEFSSKRIIFFGNTSLLCDKFSLNTYLVDEKNVLICDSLKELEGNTELKRKLWEGLKKMFLIN